MAHGAKSYVIPTQRDGNCLFRVFSCCVYNTEDRHSQIKLCTINKINNQWEYYKDFIVALSMVNNTEDNKK